jgi:hypothetical protein
MNNARQVAEQGQLSPGYADLLRRFAPHGYGLFAGAAVATVAAAVQAAAVLAGGPGLPLLGATSWSGMDALFGQVLWAAAQGLIAGYVAGNLLARLRNLAVAGYLRVVWSRYQHHVANDILDKLS